MPRKAQSYSDLESYQAKEAFQHPIDYKSDSEYGDHVLEPYLLEQLSEVDPSYIPLQMVRA